MLAKVFEVTILEPFFSNNYEACATPPLRWITPRKAQ